VDANIEINGINVEIKGIGVRHARSWESEKSGRELDRKSSVPNGDSVTTEFLLTSDAQQLFVKTQDFDLFVVVHARTCIAAEIKLAHHTFVQCTATRESYSRHERMSHESLAEAQFKLLIAW
jgi:hypothetical protein